jgi:hypothetical protein
MWKKCYIGKGSKSHSVGCKGQKVNQSTAYYICLDGIK